LVLVAKIIVLPTLQEFLRAWSSKASLKRATKLRYTPLANFFRQR